jgi:hypothetical protein
MAPLAPSSFRVAKQAADIQLCQFPLDTNSCVFEFVRYTQSIAAHEAYEWKNSSLPSHLRLHFIWPSIEKKERPWISCLVYGNRDGWILAFYQSVLLRALGRKSDESDRLDLFCAPMIAHLLALGTVHSLRLAWRFMRYMVHLPDISDFTEADDAVINVLFTAIKRWALPSEVPWDDLPPFALWRFMAAIRSDDTFIPFSSAVDLFLNEYYQVMGITDLSTVDREKMIQGLRNVQGILFKVLQVQDPQRRMTRLISWIDTVSSNKNIAFDKKLLSTRGLVMLWPIDKKCVTIPTQRCYVYKSATRYSESERKMVLSDCLDTYLPTENGTQLPFNMMHSAHLDEHSNRNTRRYCAIFASGQIPGQKNAMYVDERYSFCTHDYAPFPQPELRHTRPCDGLVTYTDSSVYVPGSGHLRMLTNYVKPDAFPTGDNKEDAPPISSLGDEVNSIITQMMAPFKGRASNVDRAKVIRDASTPREMAKSDKRTEELDRHNKSWHSSSSSSSSYHGRRRDERSTSPRDRHAASSYRPPAPPPPSRSNRSDHRSPSGNGDYSRSSSSSDRHKSSPDRSHRGAGTPSPQVPANVAAANEEMIVTTVKSITMEESNPGTFAKFHTDRTPSPRGGGPGAARLASPPSPSFFKVHTESEGANIVPRLRLQLAPHHHHRLPLAVQQPLFQLPPPRHHHRLPSKRGEC